MSWALRLILFMLLLALSPQTGAAQSMLTGWVIDAKTKETLPEVHVINKRSHKGTLTNGDGYFEIALQWGDTIIFSNIAYQYFHFVYRDSSTALTEVVISMEEQNYLLSEVAVTGYKLTTNKPRAVPLRKPNQPRNEELRSDEEMLNSLLTSGGMLYRLFSDRARQLALLRRLQLEDAYRAKLEESNNRVAVERLTGLDQSELEALMFYCKYAPGRISTLNDYEFLISVQYCFRQYLKDKEMESFLQQFD